MIKLNKITIILPLIFIAGYVMGINNPDSTHSFNSFKLYELKNQWLKTGNIAGITFNPEENIGEVLGGYQLTDGDFHRIREANSKNDFFIQTESFQKIKGISFYGNFSYHNSNEKGNLWSGVFSPYRGNPYIMGDSIPGANYHKETFTLAGGIAKNLNDNFSAGLSVDYFVGVGAKQKDPRPENIVMDFSINPSVILKLQKIKIGFDAGYRNRKEETDYRQVASDNPDPTFFVFKGFGFFKSSIGTGESRFQTEKNYFGGIQLETQLFGFESLSEIRGNYTRESTDDGSSIIKKADAGDWETIHLKLNQQFSLQKENVIHNIILKGAFLNGDGIEYTQEIVFDEDKHANYITVAKNLKFNRQTISAEIEYNYLNLTADKKIDWDISAFAHFLMNNEKYHYIPEVFNADYSNVNAGLKFEKNFYSNNIHITPGLSGSYIKNLSNNYLLSNDAEITKKQNKEVYLFDFDYYTQDLLKINGSLNIGFDTNNLKSIDQVYCKLNYSNWFPFNVETKKEIYTVNVGFLF